MKVKYEYLGQRSHGQGKRSHRDQTMALQGTYLPSMNFLQLTVSEILPRQDPWTDRRNGDDKNFSWILYPQIFIPKKCT